MRIFTGQSEAGFPLPSNPFESRVRLVPEMICHVYPKCTWSAAKARCRRSSNDLMTNRHSDLLNASQGGPVDSLFT